MANLPLIIFDKTTGRVYQMGTLDGVDTTGMQDATPLPAGSGTPIELEVQYGNKAVQSVGVMAYGGGNSITTPPGAPASVTAASVNANTYSVHATAPLAVGSPPYRSLVIGLSSDAPGTLVLPPAQVLVGAEDAVFSDLQPGVYTPYSYAFGAGGFGPVTYGAPFTIAGTGVPPVITGVPTISGAAKYASTLTLTLPTVTGAASSAIQWLSDGHLITGAASNTFKLTGAEFGTKISARVTYTSADGSIASATSLQTAAVGKADMTRIRVVPSISGSGEVGTVHTIDWGGYESASFGYSPLAQGGGGGYSSAFYLDGILVPSGTSGMALDYSTWTPQLADNGKVAIAKFSLFNNAYINDKTFESLPITIHLGASSSLTTVVDSAVDRGSMVTLGTLGATAQSVISLTIAARTDTALTGGVGVFELDQAGLDAWMAADYTTAAAHEVQVSDIGPYAPGTPLQIGPFSALTKALVFRPIGSGTYTYTLAFDSLSAPSIPAYALMVDGGVVTIDGNPVTIPPAA